MKIVRRPEWLQKKITPGSHAEMEKMLTGLKLHTVCQEAMCPNITECFRDRQATFLILGKICTRSCSFCNVSKEHPLPIDSHEPERVVEAVQLLKLAHVVITSPTRDDLPDGGAAGYAATVRALQEKAPEVTVELLVPDFGGNHDSIATVVASDPDIFGHNVETVPRLYDIRAGADYRRSLDVLTHAKSLDGNLKTKSGIMVGMGESEPEVEAVLTDLAAVGCSYVSIGQYLAPSRKHYPVQEFVPPEVFDRYAETARRLGFLHVESGPYVRSSYHAARYEQGKDS